MDEHTEYPVHSAAALFPLLSGDDLQQLADDIKQHGLIEPILLHGGMILDGRNRLAACKLAGIAPRYEDAHINGDSPTLYVVSKNLHRRHLTAGQRSTIGADMVPLLKAEARDRISAGAKHGGKTAGSGRPKAKNSPDGNSDQGYSGEPTVAKYGRSLTLAGAAVGVDGSSVHRARRIQQADAAEFERVKRGDVSLNAAYQKVVRKKEPKPRQPRMPKLPKEDKPTDDAKAQLIRVMSMARGLCSHLSELDVTSLRDMMPADEIKTWANVGYEAAKNLRALSRRLKDLL